MVNPFDYMISWLVDRGSLVGRYKRGLLPRSGALCDSISSWSCQTASRFPNCYSNVSSNLSVLVRNWCKRFGTSWNVTYFLFITHDLNRRITMCVRTLVGSESNEPVVVYNNQSKLQKTKEKYIKLHNDFVTKESEIIRRRKNQTVFIPELADDILRASTINYSSFLKALSTYYETIRQTKIFKYVIFWFLIYLLVIFIDRLTVTVSESFSFDLSHFFIRRSVSTLMESTTSIIEHENVTSLLSKQY